jgi:hypothetical protein
MQYIGIRLESESGGKISDSDINFGDIVNALEDNTKEKYPWLWGIDPYGYTVFNLHQTPHLIAELKGLSSEIKQDAVKDIISRAVDFINKIEQHTYIKLVGD